MSRAAQETATSSSPSSVRNVVSQYLSSIVIAVAALLTSREIVRGLGEDGYGVWSLLQSLLVFSALAAGGIGPAIVRFVATAIGGGDVSSALGVIKTSRRLLLRVATVVAVYCLVIYGLLPFAFRIPESLLTPVKAAWALLGVAAVFDLLARTHSAVLAGAQRHESRNYAKAIVTVVQAILIVVSMRRGLGLGALAMSVLASMVLLLVLWGALVRRVFPESKQWREAEASDWRTLKRYSSATLVIYLASTMVYGLDAVVVATILGAVNVAFYAPAVRLVEMVRMTSYALLNVVVPKAAETHARGDMHALETLSYRTSRVGLFVAGPIVAAGLTMGDRVIVAWLADDAFIQAFPVLVALLASEAVLSGTGVMASVLVATGYAAALARLEALMATCNLALSIVACYLFGLIGPAVVTTATTIVSGLILQPRLCRTKLGISTAPIFRNLARATFALGLSTLVMLYGARPRVIDAGFSTLVVQSLPFVILAYLIYGTIVLDAEDRRRISLWLRNRLR